MLDNMKAMVKEKDMAVLATVSKGQPHCSLMAYLCNDQCTEIYMVTSRKSKKYKNLTRNPMVSMLVDTRGEGDLQDRKDIKALTITGQFKPIKIGEKKAAIQKLMLARHPHLENMIQDEHGEIIAIRITSFLLLNGPLKAHFEKMP